MRLFYFLLPPRESLISPGPPQDRPETAPRRPETTPRRPKTTTRRPYSLIHVYFADFPLPVLYIPSLCFNVIPNVLCLPYSSFIRNLMWLPHPTLSPAAAAGGSRGRSSAVPLPCPTPIILLGTQPSAVCICIYIYIYIYIYI